jgi:hypothetical protein
MVENTDALKVARTNDLIGHMVISLIADYRAEEVRPRC